jgi:hypothetical protein
MRFFRFLSSLFLVLLMLLPALPAAAQETTTLDPENISTYYPETGHNVSYEIKQFFDANGGVTRFGLPLTEVVSDTMVVDLFVEVPTTLPRSTTTTTAITDMVALSPAPATTTSRQTIVVEPTTGLLVQYFERARIEYNPNLPPDNRISLSRVGSLVTQGNRHPAFTWLSGTADPQRDFYPQSGHTLGGVFRHYWQNNGDIAVFGYPISEEFEEMNPMDGKSYRVQYFERARLEYHPEHQGTSYEVQQGLVGKQLLEQHPWAATLKKSALPIRILGSATTSYAASIREREHNIGRATDMFNGIEVPAQTEFSFNAIGDFTEENGFVNGYAIVGGRLEEVTAGGICQVSTTMFRAVSNAGLRITNRVGHSFIINFYENILGFDATVYDPGIDFRWYNDTPGPVWLYSRANSADATVTFWVWGYDDGRTVTYDGPHTSGWVEPGPAVWEYDPTLPPGAVVQLVHGRSGTSVTYIRTVTMPDGTILHQDNYYTNYQPWADFYAYGPGVFDTTAQDEKDTKDDKDTKDTKKDTKDTKDDKKDTKDDKKDDKKP